MKKKRFPGLAGASFALYATAFTFSAPPAEACLLALRRGSPPRLIGTSVTVARASTPGFDASEFPFVIVPLAAALHRLPQAAVWPGPFGAFEMPYGPDGQAVQMRAVDGKIRSLVGPTSEDLSGNRTAIVVTQRRLTQQVLKIKGRREEVIASHTFDGGESVFFITVDDAEPFTMLGPEIAFTTDPKVFKLYTLAPDGKFTESVLFKSRSCRNDPARAQTVGWESGVTDEGDFYFTTGEVNETAVVPKPRG